MAVIECKHVSKRYSKESLAVNDVSLKVERGALLALLGASGCGKTTTLRLIAGLEKPDVGEVWLNGRMMAGEKTWIPPEERSIGMVFQDYALFPHLTVAGNVAFPLNKLPSQKRKQRIQEVLKLVGLPDLEDRYPHQLSGGQQQRVALARALAPDPLVVLLDEPFSNLDAALRKSTREEVRAILKAAGATTIFVTHDQEEALSISDQVAVMQSGRVLQVGTPQQVYQYPNRREVAAFVGEANFVRGTAEGDFVTCSPGKLPLLEPAHGEVEVMIRPEMIDLVPEGSAKITAIQFLGYDQLVKVQLQDHTELHARLRTHIPLEIGMPVHINIHGKVLAYS